jgi:hypothetical protein
VDKLPPVELDLAMHGVIHSFPSFGPVRRSMPAAV